MMGGWLNSNIRSIWNQKGPLMMRLISSKIQGDGVREGGGIYIFLLGPMPQEVMTPLQLAQGLIHAHSDFVS